MKKTIISPAQSSEVYTYVQALKSCFRSTKKKLKTEKLDRIVVRLEPEGTARGKVLFSYIINGFLVQSKDQIANNHTNIWQSVNMAEIFVELGYIVDVISWRNDKYIPEGEYAAFVDVRRNMERLAPLLNDDCVKIAHLDTSHILFHNAAEAKRLLELQIRRSIILQPRRFEPPNLLIDYADYATTVGNDACINTFSYANKKIFKLPTPCATTYDWIEDKNWNHVRNNFLWFSSSGFVHKGLDLVLDAFRDLPDCHLTICVTLEKDKDFINAYHNELFNTPNIETIGWVDIEGDQFKKIIKNCVAMLHISCSEAGTGSVKMGMHAGLIPIISYETASDVEDFGLILNNSSVDEIKHSVRYIANLSAEKLEARSRKAWEFARKHHTRENYAIKYKEVISEILYL